MSIKTLVSMPVAVGFLPAFTCRWTSLNLSWQTVLSELWLVSRDGCSMFENTRLSLAVSLITDSQICRRPCTAVILLLKLLAVDVMSRWPLVDMQ